MTKAEMEAHRAEYYARLTTARLASQQALYREAIKAAVSSWHYIDGMMQFERKYEEREFTNIEAIDIVLEYAPPLLDFQSLGHLEALLKTERRIAKNTSGDLHGNLEKAKELMWHAHRLWNHLETHADARQDKLAQELGGNHARWRSVVEVWEKAGLLIRTPEAGSFRLALRTQPTQAVLGKCQDCGALAKASKRKFWTPQRCPKCGTTGLFVMPSKMSASNARE